MGVPFIASDTTLSKPHPISTCDPSFGIPHDVSFQIMDNNNLNVMGEVKGHKLILGLYSPVFK